jgi:hypothetical protein
MRKKGGEMISGEKKAALPQPPSFALLNMIY